MADNNNAEPAPAAAGRRRSSFAGIVDMFASSRNNANNSPPNGTSPFPGPISHAAAQAQQRRLSITTIGLGSSPNPPSASPFGSLRSRGQSISSSGSASVDESPFEEGDGTPPKNPSSPFARRVSFGARALRDVRAGSGGGGGGGGGTNAHGRPSVIHTAASDRPKPAANSPPTAKGREGFSFAENMRARAERGSISAPSGPNLAAGSAHGRAKSIAAMEPPAREIPPQPRKPDQFQERILKGDFYMD